MVLTLKHSDPEVAAAIQEVMTMAYRIEAEILGIQNFPPLYRKVAEIAATDDATFCGIHVADVLVAVAEINFLESGNVHIDSLVVRPDYFRRGLATALLKHIFSAYFTRTFSVSTGAKNQPALHLYRSLGFKTHLCWSANDGVEMMTLKRTAENDLNL